MDGKKQKTKHKQVHQGHEHVREHVPQDSRVSGNNEQPFQVLLQRGSIFERRSTT
jgi:hypothetical protein